MGDCPALICMLGAGQSSSNLDLWGRREWGEAALIQACGWGEMAWTNLDMLAAHPSSCCIGSARSGCMKLPRLPVVKFPTRETSRLDVMPLQGQRLGTPVLKEQQALIKSKLKL